MKLRHILCNIGIFLWVLGVKDGYLALYAKNEPVHIFPYPVAGFTSQIQNALKAGIPISDMDDLIQTLRGYLS